MHSRFFFFLRVVFLILHWAVAASVFAEAASEATNPSVSVAAMPADIEAFVRPGCPHCAEAEEFLADLQNQKPSLHIVIHNIAHKSQGK